MSTAIVRLIPAILVTGFLITAAPTQGLAQGMGQEMIEKMANKQTARMKTELKLTPDQVQKVSQINMTEARGFQQAFGKGGADKQGMIREALEAHKTREMELQQVLTPQQWQMFQAKKPERTARMLTRMMAFQLNLTDQQIPQVGQINLTAVRELQSEMASAGGRQGKPMRDKLRAVKDIKSALDERDQSLRRVLTPTQWGTYQESEQEMKEMIKQKLQEQRRQ